MAHGPHVQMLATRCLPRAIAKCGRAHFAGLVQTEESVLYITQGSRLHCYTVFQMWSCARSIPSAGVLALLVLQ